MSTATMESSLTVRGFSASVPISAGPALLSADASVIVLTVTDSDGTPVTELTSQDFALSALVRDRGVMVRRPFDFEEFGEPAPGVYAFALPNDVCRAMNTFACMADARDARRGLSSGRVVVPLAGNSGR